MSLIEWNEVCVFFSYFPYEEQYLKKDTFCRPAFNKDNFMSNHCAIIE